MAEMVEKVAAAIWALQRDTDCNDYSQLWDGRGSAKELAREMARAAIEAMREPTEAMRAAKDAIDMGAGTDGIWPAMISAALSDPKEEGK